MVGEREKIAKTTNQATAGSNAFSIKFISNTSHANNVDLLVGWKLDDVLEVSSSCKSRREDFLLSNQGMVS